MPFYQLVITGLFAYCAEPINLQGDTKQYLLESLETGSMPHYSFITEDNTLINGTDLDWLYGADFENNKDALISNFEVIKQLYAATKGSRMIKHNIIENGVACTTYENGAKVYVNYTDSAFENEGLGISIASMGYLICEAEGSVNEK